jgi:hypothetical protein
VSLTEVVVGLAVLGVLVASVMVARGRFARQWSEAQRKIEIAKAVDVMLAQWVGGEKEMIPLDEGGEVEGVEGVRWRTSVRRDSGAEAVGAVVVRVEVMEGRRRVMEVELMKRGEK